jgi:hypothetical protein
MLVKLNDDERQLLLEHIYISLTTKGIFDMQLDLDEFCLILPSSNVREKFRVEARHHTLALYLLSPTSVEEISQGRILSERGYEYFMTLESLDTSPGSQPIWKWDMTEIWGFDSPEWDRYEHYLLPRIQERLSKFETFWS